MHGGVATGPCMQPPGGMVAWYWMDGNANDAAALGGFDNPSGTNAISFVPGKVGQGVTFGPGGYIDIPHTTALANQQFTIDAWVKPNGAPLGPASNNDFWGGVIVQKGLMPPTGYTDVPISRGARNSRSSSSSSATRPRSGSSRARRSRRGSGTTSR